VELDLSGRRLLVVGASAGIGQAVAEMAIEAGAHVGLVARRAERLAEITAGLGDRALALPGDVTVEADCASVVDRAVTAFGGLDALLYVTGVSPLRPIGEASAADWHAVLGANVVGAALVAAAAVPHLVESRGKALFVSSKSVRQPFAGLGLYSTSKAALDAMIKALKAEHPELDVTRVVVGNTGGTEFATAWDPDTMGRMFEVWASSGALGSPGLMHPRQVAQAILAVVAARAYIDDIAIIDRPTDDGTW
jgi:NADP-dependent 3-hydroxy acid dehydrogenase YdfG